MKVSKIELKDFRGFPALEAFDLAAGKNLLLYGENGSGKSSLYRALVEFLNLNPKARPFNQYRNIFSSGANKSGIDGHVTLELEDGTRHEWRCLGSRPHADKTLPQPTRERWNDTARRAALLEYRSLLRTNLGTNNIREHLFDLSVTTLLANVPVVGAGGREKTVFQLWSDLLRNKPTRHSRAQLFFLNAAEKAFNEGFRGILPDVQRKVTDFLRYFTGSGLEISFDFSGVQYDGSPRLTRDRKFKEKFLDFEVKLNGIPVPEWNDFLNEARLSALALSLYLAGTSLSNPTPPASVGTPLKLLVLDDVLVGLDHSNRLPVLKILEECFADYQVFLLTHDRVWFEMAQLALNNPERWAVYEMYARQLKGENYTFDAPVLMPALNKLPEHFLALAEDHLDNRHDARTAALHARAAFEVKLKSYCSDKRVHVPYDLDGRHLNTDHFLNAIERRLLWSGTMSSALFAIQRVKLFRDRVLNPLAHFHPITLAVAEVKAAISAIKQLEFPKGTCNFPKKTSELLSKATLSNEDKLDATCWLRTAFEVDVRALLITHGGKVLFRENWNEFTLAELWDSAKEAMLRVNSASAASLIADIETHRAVFLNDWRYDTVSQLDKSTLDAAWAALRNPALGPGVTKTRLATFT